MSNIDGLDELNRRLNAIADTRMLLGRVALQAVAYAKAEVPRKTGNLGRTIRLGSVTDTDAQILAGGTAGVGYAKVVELGSRPHDIYPRRKKALFFSSQPGASRLTGSVRSPFRGSASARAAGGAVFAKHVRHPGTKPHPYLRPAAERAVREQWPEAIIKAWNDAA